MDKRMIGLIGIMILMTVIGLVSIQLPIQAPAGMGGTMVISKTLADGVVLSFELGNDQFEPYCSPIQ